MSSVELIAGRGSNSSCLTGRVPMPALASILELA
jgi:hypothetical protein